jgi:S-adenosylmethionine-diacylglycerol 3-amino-3-carboxypropyl transferase
MRAWPRSGFMRTLNYTSVNEDWRTEAAGLRIGATDDVLCITGSGARPLDLLALDPARVVAIDLNPVQNHLLHLKIAAMRRLPYEEYAAFLGLRAASAPWRPGARRAELWRALSAEVPPATRDFWGGRPAMIRAGVLYLGRWERFYRRAAMLGRLLRPRAIPALFEFRALEDQRDFVRRHWDTPLWRAAWATVCSPVTSRLVFRDPAYYRHVAVPVARVLYERMRASLERYLARENFMVGLCLRGWLPDGDLPPHLTPEGHATIRTRLDRLQVVTADVVEYLHEPARGGFTRFSLSDVPSFLTAPGFEALVDGATRSAAPGARVVIRQFLTRYTLPASLAARLAREPELEVRLAREDRAFAYDFLVAEVRDA